jgi:hypothetical protein
MHHYYLLQTDQTFHWRPQSPSHLFRGNDLTVVQLDPQTTRLRILKGPLMPHNIPYEAPYEANRRG